MMKKTDSPHILLKKSKIHGIGIYAKKNIPQGTRVIEYAGEKITKAESDRRAHKPFEENEKDSQLGAVYLFALNDRHDIDGHVPWNTARYINHSCSPNCETEIIRGKIWVVALRDIKKGEELFYNYGYDYEDYEEHPCHCGADNCIGFILAEEHWRKLKRLRTIRKNKRKRSK